MVVVVVVAVVGALGVVVVMTMMMMMMMMFESDATDAEVPIHHTSQCVVVVTTDWHLVTEHGIQHEGFLSVRFQCQLPMR